LERAQQGDAGALPALHRLFASDGSLWRQFGDLAVQAERSLIAAASGTNLLLAEALQRKLQELRSELEGPSPSPMEGLLASRAALCWLETHYLDALAAQSPGQAGKQATDLQRRRDAADRRYLGALKALATIRRLLTNKAGKG
jgi:hypothetical protein